MAMVRIKQVRSSIGHPKNQKDTLIALGLRKIGKSVEKEVNPQIQGMINKVSHLVSVEEI
ncbi:MAG: 50S ribosomal protein L30 [Saprospiraceae bacterium]